MPEGDDESTVGPAIAEPDWVPPAGVPRQRRPTRLVWSDAQEDPVGHAVSQAGNFLTVSRDQIFEVARHHVGRSFELVTSQSAMRCDHLAKLARAMLNARNAAGRVLADGFDRLADDHEKELVLALAQRVPLPGTSELVLVGRALQLAGICLCSMNSIPLSRCPCLIDIVSVDGHRLVRSLLSQGRSDWRALADLVPEPA
ncbi:hypothetical protein ACFQ3B_22890 [Stackebrandtia endophytica]|uniref:hypothetical protein n=1 Tax=Stackebrandtia endophytica TaxID=1496996 RepID=UPI001150399B|nr:hypothetical protein [Stackebrandtia endophytica]